MSSADRFDTSEISISDDGTPMFLSNDASLPFLIKLNGKTSLQALETLYAHCTASEQIHYNLSSSDRDIQSTDVYKILVTGKVIDSTVLLQSSLR